MTKIHRIYYLFKRPSSCVKVNSEDPSLTVRLTRWGNTRGYYGAAYAFNSHWLNFRIFCWRLSRCQWNICVIIFIVYLLEAIFAKNWTVNWIGFFLILSFVNIEENELFNSCSNNKVRIRIMYSKIKKKKKNNIVQNGLAFRFWK